MALVNIMVNGRAYTIACDDGEEDHLRELAVEVDAKVRELLGSVGQAGETRLLLMAALLLADDRHDAQAQLHLRNQQVSDLSTSHDGIASKLQFAQGELADTLEAAAQRLENIAAGLATD